MIESVNTEGRKSKKVPQRVCIGCRQKMDKSKLLRFVRSPDGEILVDHPRRLGGRGVYLCSTTVCIERAFRSPKLGHFFGGGVVSQETSAMEQMICDRVIRRVQGLLASAGRSRKVVLGSQQVESWLNQGAQASDLVILASDVSSRVRNSVVALSEKARVRVCDFGDREQLGMAFSRSLLGAVGLTDGGFSSAVIRELELLQGLTTIQEKPETPNLGQKALERAT